MTSPPKLIASDLDGTLCRSDGSISDRTAKALARAAADDVDVVLVTGRPVRWMKMIFPQLGADYPAVCANGGAVLEPATGEITVVRPLRAAEVMHACEVVRAALPTCHFAAEIRGSTFMLYEPGYTLRWDLASDDKATATVAEIASSEPVKLLVRQDGWDSDELAAVVAAAVGPALTATHSSPYGLVELSPPGVDKGAGLAAHASRAGLSPADAIVFGDMPNDIPMFTWATNGGGIAVAVGNAHPLVRAAATVTVGTNEDDGVAAYLESVLDA